jgi:hypothetical protein
MRFGKWSGVAMILAILTVSRAAAVPVSREPPSPETVAKLIEQLGSADVQLRQRASERLEELGGSILPDLRQAIAAKTEPEVKRRLDLVVTRIENNLRKAEEKRWQDLDAPRRGLKDRLVAIVVKTPTLSDRQRASAVYLLAVGRPPTPAEVKRAQKQLVETNGRAASALSLARSLVQSEKFSAEVAEVNIRLTKVKTDLAGETDLAKQLHRLNSDEFQKMNRDVAGSLTRLMKTDVPLIDLAFLLMLSRFPRANEMEQANAHLKKVGRPVGTEDIIWALLNTKEFLRPE